MKKKARNAHESVGIVDDPRWSVGLKLRSGSRTRWRFQTRGPVSLALSTGRRAYIHTVTIHTVTIQTVTIQTVERV